MLFVSLCLCVEALPEAARRLKIPPDAASLHACLISIGEFHSAKTKETSLCNESSIPGTVPA
jgi:hypothetical protein